MDQTEGLDLDRVVQQKGPLRVSQAVDYLIQAARELEVDHARGIIHRDIRPSKLMLDSNGTVRVLGLGLTDDVDANDRLRNADARLLTNASTHIATIGFRAPELCETSQQFDHRADIYSLGCTLFYMLTGREPFSGDTFQEQMTERAGQMLRAVRPDVPLALEAAYERMVAARPEDRPTSMTEVIALLEASTGILVRREEREGLLINHEWNLEDLVLDRRPRDLHTARKSHPAHTRRLNWTRFQALSQRNRATLVTIGALALFAAAFVGIAVSRRPDGATDETSSKLIVNSDRGRYAQTVESPQPTPVAEARTIFDGKSGQGWMLCNRAPLPPQNIQHDGLNPHSTGSYLVVYDQKLGDFVLDFDYKLSKGCNSGVFLRVSDLNNPINTGIEVALDDTRWGGDQDSGALHGLVAPEVYAQNPSGHWNHMTITAQGPRLTVSLNEREVSSINLDLWTLPGKRPDGSIHQFKNRAIAHMARTGYLGFQDLGGDCWYKNIVLKSNSVGRRSAPTSS
jgi:serine/threonine protein kinase